MYGSVAMLKTIADLYKYASFECFKDLKLYFIHMHTKHIRLWSISSPSPGIFVMTREDKCGIPTAFNDDTHILLDYIRFGWSLKERIEKTLAKIDDLEEAHKVKMKEYRYKKLPKDRDLSCLVNPAIIKITERVHACYFVDDGPDSSPLIPLFP
ncbi:hypothetical protein K492DRAFT_222835 [Lichtheimia hyalospora FSU 10163]|nr:hypothetical protein K492DRAFT_222835 [Lichtheimia hyalospora FSU 10163]